MQTHEVILDTCCLIWYVELAVTEALQAISCWGFPEILVHDIPGIPHCHARTSADLGLSTAKQ
jgi:hypothetical protein